MATPPTPCETKKSTVVELIRPFDPLNRHAEELYDAVVRRVNHARLRRIKVGRELAELERQFVDNELVDGADLVDLASESDAGRRRPLSKPERRKRLERMLELSAHHARLGDEEQFGVTTLDRMNDALDRWARETYGA